ncbi:MAG: oligoendopeptidase F [Nitrospinales bacterium]
MNIPTTGPASRKNTAEEFTWNLSDLYDDTQSWEKDFESLQSQLLDYSSLQNTLHQSPANLKTVLDFDMKISRKIENLYTFAHLRNDEDKTENYNQTIIDKVTGLITKVRQARSFINTELMEIPQDKINEFLKDEELQDYIFYLEQLLRFRNHTLSKKEEELIAASADFARTAKEAFGMLDNADLKLGLVKDENGEDKELTQGNFQSFMQNKDRRVRREAFDTFYSEYNDHQYTFASLLSGSVKKDIFYSRARKYPSVREQALYADNIPISVYDNLIKTVHENLNPLYKYFDLRKRILKLDEIHIYDCAVPLVKSIKWNMSYDDAVENICAALNPLGNEYVSIMRKGLMEDRWVDRYENQGKRSGAYSSGCYDSNPFILMNYTDDNINSVYTLAHEAGHSMHSWFSRNNQPYHYSDYTIFVAEVASTFNEALLTKYLLSNATDEDMKTYLVCREIDNLKGTLIRQTMFAEFEYLIYQAAENGEALTVDYIKNLYKNLLDLYFGDKVVIDPSLSLECFRIPHFYFSFYVYKYATGISAAYALAEGVSSGGETELKNYQKFLESGGSRYPIDLLKEAGVDMGSSQPIQTALGKFSDLVNQLEKLVS